MKEYDVNTIEKRTFATGSTIELYQRKDETYRIKFTTRDGCDLVYAVPAPKMTESNYNDFASGRYITAEDEFKEILACAERFHISHTPKDGAAIRADTLEDYVVWVLLTKCHRQFVRAARIWADNNDAPVEGGYQMKNETIA